MSFEGAGKIPEAAWQAPRLINLRRQLDISQEELARRIHVRINTLKLWESGRGGHPMGNSESEQTGKETWEVDRDSCGSQERRPDSGGHSEIAAPDVGGGDSSGRQKTEIAAQEANRDYGPGLADATGLGGRPPGPDAYRHYETAYSSGRLT